MKLKKGVNIIDQHDKFGFYCNGKFGGNFVAETARKPIEDLSLLFEKLRRSKKFLKRKIQDLKVKLRKRFRKKKMLLVSQPQSPWPLIAVACVRKPGEEGGTKVRFRNK